MTELEKKAKEMQDRIDEFKSFLDEFNGDDGLKKKFEELKAKFEGLKIPDLKDSEELKSLDEALNGLKTQVEDLKNKSNPFEQKTLGDALLELKSNKEFKELVTKLEKASKASSMKGINGTFEIKADTVTGALTGTQQRSVIDLTVDKPAYRMPFMRQLVPNMPTQKQIIKWVERTAHTNGAGGVAENAASGASDSAWENKSREVVKRGVHFKYTNESFEDINELVNDLRQDCVTEMELDIDNQMLKGDGTGTNFYGIIGDATAFNATTAGVNDKVKKASLTDLIKAMALQAFKANRRPDTALVNPTDFTLMELEKDANGNYILPPFRSADGTLISGVRIIQNNNVTANTCLVFDSMLPKLYVRRDMQIQVWDQNEDDAINDRKTVTLWFRGQMRVRENEKAGIIYASDITAALAAMDPDVA